MVRCHLDSVGGVYRSHQIEMPEIHLRGDYIAGDIRVGPLLVEGRRHCALRTYRCRYHQVVDVGSDYQICRLGIAPEKHLHCIEVVFYHSQVEFKRFVSFSGLVLLAAYGIRLR